MFLPQRVYNWKASLCKEWPSWTACSTWVRDFCHGGSTSSTQKISFKRGHEMIQRLLHASSCCLRHGSYREAYGTLCRIVTKGIQVSLTLLEFSKVNDFQGLPLDLAKLLTEKFLPNYLPWSFYCAGKGMKDNSTVERKKDFIFDFWRAVLCKFTEK